MHTSGYRPQCNSICERFNSTLAECLSLYCNEKQSNWCSFVKPVCYAYNSKVQASTLYSPCEIMFGYKGILPPDRV